MKRIQNKINSRKSMSHVVKQIIAGAILHNLLLSYPLLEEAINLEVQTDDEKTENDDENDTFTTINIMGSLKRAKVLNEVLVHFNQ